jgi:hypothetical protein
MSIEDGKMVNKFYSLELELRKINAALLDLSASHYGRKSTVPFTKDDLPIRKVRFSFCKNV